MFAAETARARPRPTVTGSPPGAGVLRVVRAGRRSVATRVCATSPLKLLTPGNHGTAAWVYASTYGGGLVDGDAVRVAIDVGPGAEALWSTQAATKIYRSPRGTTADLTAVVHEGGLLVVVPDPVLCYAGARYAQTQQVTLARGAGVVLLDWLSSGRRAAGERWAFDRYHARTQIRYDGRLVLYDALLLDAAEGDLATRMGRFEVVAVIALVGPSLVAEAGRLVSTAAGAPVTRRADVLHSASPIGEMGCLVRIAGVSIEAVGHAVREALRFVPARLGDDPWRRKW